MDTPTRRTNREPRTFELRDSQWVEATASRRLRPPYWVLFPVALAAMTGVVLITFAALAALATGLLLRARSSVLRWFGR
jgi:hypothetical protein